MKKLLGAVLVAGLLVSGTAMADNTQQTRMADCNKQATGKKGDERKTFMKACLSGNMPADTAASGATPVDKNGKPLTAQQMKMKDCAGKNKGMKGDAYKKAMSECMKN